MDTEDVDALGARFAGVQVPFTLLAGDCNARIDDVVAEIPARGVNVALIDPSRLADLSFATIARLALSNAWTSSCFSLWERSSGIL